MRARKRRGVASWSLHGGVRQAFVDDRNPFEAALATLDLVVSHLEEGNTAEVRALADELARQVAASLTRERRITPNAP